MATRYRGRTREADGIQRRRGCSGKSPSPGTHTNRGATWNYDDANQAKGALLALSYGRSWWGGGLPFFLPRWGTGASVPTPPWAPFPHLYPRGPSPLETPHVGSPSPPSLACPLLLRPCGHGCVWWLGGAAVPGNQARSVWSVCLVGESTGGPAPSLPSFLPPPQAPLIVRPARPARPVGSFLETRPCVKPAPSLVGENLRVTW